MYILHQNANKSVRLLISNAQTTKHKKNLSRNFEILTTFKCSFSPSLHVETERH